MITFIRLTLCMIIAVLCWAEDHKDFRPEATQQRIYDIIQSHEGRKYGGGHGGHEYGVEEQPLRKNIPPKTRRYGYLVGLDENNGQEQHNRDYYEVAPNRAYIPKEDVYRENVGSYAPKEQPRDHIAISPVSNDNYAVVEPKPHDGYVVLDPKAHVSYPVDPKTQGAYQIVDPKHHYVIDNPKIHHIVGDPKAVYASEQAYADQIVDKAHQEQGHGYHGNSAANHESGHKKKGHYEDSGHDAHAAQIGHHGHHAKHHNRGSYERDRGYHYEKAYAYDRIRAHHDVGSSQGAHHAYKAHHGQQGHQNKAHNGGESFMYFKKKGDHGGGHYLDKNSYYKRGDQAGQGHYDYGVKHPYGYEKL